MVHPLWMLEEGHFYELYKLNSTFKNVVNDVTCLITPKYMLTLPRKLIFNSNFEEESFTFLNSNYHPCTKLQKYQYS